ncbi:helix-turn-helix domain-containing protein [Kineobactrum salinum]|uniref:Helix-turn-helix transcriptional regulator n=1 Tax=Kineobactrum salinum TaxID=2708301 RepID=A0A6C0U4H7_9GAMM|nr:AraC family transcriptional regulator [Kineobactrum salinum]QIB67060.1 helix-turn-helix transcriptional regulator [Kineobactrum salinum]
MEPVEGSILALMQNTVKGLFRTHLVGPGASLSEAFSTLDSSEKVDGFLAVPQRGLRGGQTKLSVEEGEGHWELQCIGDDIYVVASRCRFHDARREVVPPEGFIEIHICLSGPVHLQLAGKKKFSSSSPFMFVCRQGANARYTVRFEPGRREMLAFYVRPSVLDTFGLHCGGDIPYLRDLLDTGDDSITYQQLPISVPILGVATQIMHNQLRGQSRLIYTEAKTWELLSLFLDELSQPPGQLAGLATDVFAERDLAMFEQARSILQEQLSAKLTIAALARAVGTNTTKLKHGFKLCFGMTILEFSHQCKMEEALRLLVDEQISVGMVAQAVGYQHQASFSSAFKEYYGILPKEARKLKSGAYPKRARKEISRSS